MVTNKITQFVKTYRGLVNLHNATVIFTFMGGCIGSLYGLYDGYNMSKNDHILLHVSHTVGGCAVGIISGSFMGIVWPITIPIISMRAYDRGKFDSSILFAKSRR